MPPNSAAIGLITAPAVSAMLSISVACSSSFSIYTRQVEKMHTTHNKPSCQAHARR
jgi:hypothetical protein